MAYSRWGESYWYTYWCIRLKEGPEDRDNAIFEVCPLVRFSAKELRDDIETCVKQAVEACDKCTTQPLESEVDDLREFMREFFGRGGPVLSTSSGGRSDRN
jgi:hypothetical protein